MTTEKDQFLVDTGDSSEKIAELTARVAALEAQLKKSGQESKNSGKDLDYFSQTVKDAQSSFLAATTGFNLMSAALSGIAEFMKDGVKGALEQEAAQRRLATSLRMAGDSSGFYTGKLIEQAESVEALTGTNAEHVEAIQALLAQMGVAPAQIERMTNAALRLANATGQDATQAARLLARANNEGSDELKKYGINVDDATFAARGFESVLEQVEQRFAPLETTIPEQVRQMNALNAAWDDFSKAVGNFLLDQTKDSGAFDFLTEGLKGLAAIIPAVSAAFKELTLGFLSLEGAKNKFMMLDYAGAMLDAKEATDHFEAATVQANVKLMELLSTAGEAANDDTVMVLPAMKFIVPSKEELRKQAADALKAKEEADKLFTNSPSNIQAQERREEAKAMDEANKAIRDKLKEQGDWEVAQAQYTADEKRAIADAALAYNQQAAQDAAEIALKSAVEAQRIMASVKQQAIEWGTQMLQSMGSYIQGAIANMSQFGNAMAELSAKRELVAQGEDEANITRADLEKQMAKDRAAAFLKMTSDMLAQIAIQAGMKAIWEAGEAIAAAARYDFGSAAAHGTAAGIYAGVAVAAGGTAMAISATRPMTSDEQQQLASAEGSGKSGGGSTKGIGDTGAANDTPAPDKGTQVNVYNLGITGQTKEAQGAALDEILASYSDLRTGTR